MIQKLLFCIYFSFSFQFFLQFEIKNQFKFKAVLIEANIFMLFIKLIKINKMSSTLNPFRIEQKIQQFVHNHFGLVQYRQRIKVRKDAFFELIPNEDSPADNELMRRLSKTIIKLGQFPDITYLQDNKSIASNNAQKDISKDIIKQQNTQIFNLVLKSDQNKTQNNTSEQEIKDKATQQGLIYTIQASSQVQMLFILLFQKNSLIFWYFFYVFSYQFKKCVILVKNPIFQGIQIYHFNYQFIQKYKQNTMRKRVIIISIALLLQIVQLFKNKAKRAVRQSLLSIAQSLSALSPTDLIKNFDKLENYGICIGEAQPSQKCMSILKKNQSVIISKLYELKNIRFRSQMQNLKELIRTKRPTYFILKDKASSIPILQTANLPTMTTHGIQAYSNVDKSSQINIVISLINLIKNIRIPYVSDTSFSQHYLPAGSRIAILGKYKRQGPKSISCEKPIMMAKSKNHLIEKLQYKVSQLKFCNLALAAGVAFCVVFLLNQGYKYYLQQKKRRLDPVENYDKIYVKSRVCYNCHNKLSNFILQNCGHLSMCKQCKQKTKICGECKKRGQNGLQLFAC